MPRAQPSTGSRSRTASAARRPQPSHRTSAPRRESRGDGCAGASEWAGSSCRRAPGAARRAPCGCSARSSRRAPRSPCSRRCGRRTSAKGAVMPNCWRKRSARGVGHLGADANDDPGHVRGLRDVPDHRAFLVRVVHEGTHAPEHRAEHREADRRIAFRCRHEQRAIGDGARSVERVPVAIAEEDEPVVCRPRASRTCRRSAGLVGPSASSHASSSWMECTRLKTASCRRAKSVTSRWCATGNRRTGTPWIVFDARGQLVRPGDVIARAGRKHLHLMVAREPLGHVARVLLRAAVDVGAVALNDDRQLHCRSSSRSSGASGSSRTSRPAGWLTSGVASAMGTR